MNSRVSKTKTAEPDRGVVWSISFGDLLTLLVCFFLVLTPWKKLGAPPNPSGSDSIQGSDEAGDFSGIPIATSAIKHGYGQSSDTPQEGVVSEIPLWVSDVEQGYARAAVTITRSLSDEITRVSETARQIGVTIRLCEQSVDRSQVLEVVRGALASSKLMGAPVTVRLDGTTCSETRVLRPVTDAVLGTIRLERI